jgi:hypothetical protein
MFNEFRLNPSLFNAKWAAFSIPFVQLYAIDNLITNPHKAVNRFETNLFVRWQVQAEANDPKGIKLKMLKDIHDMTFKHHC